MNGNFRNSDEIRNKRIDRMNDLNNYPVHLQKIVEIILTEGENLSDGIGYYANYEVILEFAQKIYQVTRK